MFDLTCTDRKRFHSSSLPMAELRRSAEEPPYYGLVVWEEHCLECGQPYCFKTCKFYERGFDGKCRRFEYGFAQAKLAKNGYVFACTFRKWGKIEGVFTGQVVSRRTEHFLQGAELVLGTVVRWLNRVMSFVPGRIGAITAYRRFRKWILPAVGARRTVARLFVEAFAKQDSVLTCNVYLGERLFFAVTLELKKGWSVHDVQLPMIEKGAHIQFFSEQDTTTLAFAHLDLLPPKHAPFIKCVAWDLDNTLWEGILSEDGPGQLRLKQGAVDLIKRLDMRGIVHTIISKNDYNVAWPVIEKYGLAEYFVFPVINWGQKSVNLKAIAKSMNLGLDSFAFIDDSPFERGDVTQNLPAVRVFSEKDIPRLLMLPEFNPPVSAESGSRRLSYLKEMERKKVELVFGGDHIGFLESCLIKMTMVRLSKKDITVYHRCYELIQRTNQLTLTAKRYTPDEYARLIEDPLIEAYAIHVSDRFGDYGVIGFVAIRLSDDDARIMEFVMSCRVAMKQCEVAAVDALAKHYRKQGKHVLSACLVKTSRNGALVSAFLEMGFVQKDEHPNGIISCFIYLDGYSGQKVVVSVNGFN